MDAPVTDKRRRTEDRILAAAQALFAENGYEKTTVRAVATAAGVDAALVIRYFESKQGLFQRAARLPDAQPEPEDPDTLTDRLTDALGTKLGGLPPSALALLRSMFTHPEAGARVRAAINEEVERLGRAAPGPDAELRAGLAATMMLGITIGRGMLGLPALTEASVADIQRAVQPALRALMQQPALQLRQDSHTVTLQETLTPGRQGTLTAGEAQGGLDL